jgi:hypothetical protein
MPIVSGLILLLENIFGLLVSSLGGTRGGIFAATPFDVPPGPISLLPAGLKGLKLNFLLLLMERA